MFMLAEITAQKVAETRRWLASAHRRIELSRRLLNPAWGISGGAEADPRHSIRDRLERGVLSLASRSLAARWGGGEVCVICERLITPTEIANGSRNDEGKTAWTHLICLRLWRGESAAFEVRQIEKERNTRAELCATVRDGFADGSLYVLPHQRSRLGSGVNGRCSVCRKTLSSDETAFEVVGGVVGQPAYAHPVCYQAWWIESVAHRKLLS